MYLDELLYVESQDHITAAKLEHGEESFRIRLSDMEELLPRDRFCRCHNRCLVNMEHVSKIGRTGLTLDDGIYPAASDYTDNKAGVTNIRVDVTRSAEIRTILYGEGSYNKGDYYRFQWICCGAGGVSPGDPQCHLPPEQAGRCDSQLHE